MNKKKREREAVLQIVVSREEHEAVRKAAREKGLTISAYCRWALIYNKEEKKND